MGLACQLWCVSWRSLFLTASLGGQQVWTLEGNSLHALDPCHLKLRESTKENPHSTAHLQSCWCVQCDRRKVAHPFLVLPSSRFWLTQLRRSGISSRKGRIEDRWLTLCVLSRPLQSGTDLELKSWYPSSRSSCWTFLCRSGIPSCRSIQLLHSSCWVLTMQLCWYHHCERWVIGMMDWAQLLSSNEGS